MQFKFYLGQVYGFFKDDIFTSWNIVRVFDHKCII